MTCQNKGYNLITIERGTEDENEACFWSYNFSMCAFFIIILIPSKSLVSLISDKKVEDAATSLQKEKLQSVFLQQNVREFTVFTDVRFIRILRMDAYHPSNYFKVNPAGFTPF